MECVDFMQPRWPSTIVMLEKRKMLMDAEADSCIQLGGGFLILAQKELSAFIGAVDKLFGAEQARQAALSSSYDPIPVVPPVITANFPFSFLVSDISIFPHSPLLPADLNSNVAQPRLRLV